MAKQMRGVCLEKEIECRDQNTSIDRISMLPDELLVRILSFLSLKEATATSIFSRRWRYLWTFIPRLDFDGTESLLKIDLAKSEQQSALNNEQLNLVKWVDLAVRKRESVLDMERWNYVKWVDNVVALHKGSTIEEFRIDFNLNITHTESIDNWLRYALARKVQRLELNLTDELCMRSRTYDECYSFPYKLLRTDKRTFSISSQSWSMRECDSIDCKYLRKVSMNFVNVNGEALEFLLSNCPFLGHLSVSQSGELTTMKITGPLPSLKCLEISLCHNLNSVEIRDANLVRLIYKGKRIHFLLENVPLLVEMFIDGMITGDLKEVLLMLSSYLLQLEIFSIFRVKNFSWEETEIFYSALKMSNLKELRVQLFVFDDDSLLSLTNLIRASPCLETFLLEVSRENPKFVTRKVKKIVSPYAHLREVKFVGYSGVTSDLELVMHFVENAALLEKLLVDPRDRMDEIDNDEMDARTRAKKQLTKKIPRRVNLEIL